MGISLFMERSDFPRVGSAHLPDANPIVSGAVKLISGFRTRTTFQTLVKVKLSNNDDRVKSRSRAHYKQKRVLCLVDVRSVS